jgi:APA family basic amino acid/polyamine antiporter
VFFPIICDQNILFELAGITVSTKQLLAIVIVWLLTYINFKGIRTGALIQNIFTITKIGALLFMIGAGLYFIATQPAVNINWQLPAQINTYNYWGIFCGALVGSIFSSDAWNNVTFTGGEIDNPKRNLPLSLAIGTLGVLLLYIFIN